MILDRVILFLLVTTLSVSSSSLVSQHDQKRTTTRKTTSARTSTTTGKTTSARISTTTGTKMTAHALVMGGETGEDSYSTSIEMLTPDSVCTPDIPPLPVERQGASSVFYHDKVFYCGGYNKFSRGSHATCHS